MPLHGRATEDSFESVAKFGRYEIVTNWVDGTVDVQHDSGKIQNIQIPLQAELQNVFLGCPQQIEAHSLHWEQADEEADDDGEKHEHDLFACLQIGLVGLITFGPDRHFITEQLTTNDAVNGQQQHERHDEEGAGQGHQVDLLPRLCGVSPADLRTEKKQVWGP